jgi:hypothetical protein
MLPSLAPHATTSPFGDLATHVTLGVAFVTP